MSNLEIKKTLITEIHSLLDSSLSLEPILRRSVRLADLCGKEEYSLLFLLHLDGQRKEKEPRLKKWKDINAQPKFDIIECFNSDRRSDEGGIQGHPIQTLEHLYREGEEKLKQENVGYHRNIAININFQITNIFGRIRNRITKFLTEIEEKLNTEKTSENMTSTGFIEKLNSQKRLFEADVLSKYIAEDKRSGDLAFETWSRRFIDFLENFVPSKAERFKDHITGAGWASALAGDYGRGGDPLYKFNDVYGNFCLAFINSLIEETEKGYIDIEEGKLPSNTTSKSGNMKNDEDQKKVFVVHGHDNEAKESVARFLEKLGLNPIILHEQANGGKTIIEKFEHHANVGFAVVLLTPDDVGCAKGKDTEVQPRARQNVIFELGYFFGKLSRGKVCALYKEGIELPSDFQGILYTLMDSHGAWKYALAKEIKAAGLEIDMNKI